MIGVFDSGSGGLTVAAALHRQAPEVDIVYFGDLANMPYGEKSVAELEQLTFAGLRFLRSQGANFIVSACNSVSCAVIAPMIELLGNVHSNIIEMVGPTSKALRDHKGRLTIVATEATVKSGMYQSALGKFGIIPHMIAVAGLTAAIESGDRETVAQKIDEIISATAENKSSSLLLACTHYPLVRTEFVASAAQKNLALDIIDPAEFVATAALAHYGHHGSGITKFFISKESSQFNDFVASLFIPLTATQKIDICVPTV